MGVVFIDILIHTLHVEDTKKRQEKGKQSKASRSEARATQQPTNQATEQTERAVLASLFTT